MDVLFCSDSGASSVPAVCSTCLMQRALQRGTASDSTGMEQNLISDACSACKSINDGLHSLHNMSVREMAHGQKMQISFMPTDLSGCLCSSMCPMWHRWTPELIRSHAAFLPGAEGQGRGGGRYAFLKDLLTRYQGASDPKDRSSFCPVWTMRVRIWMLFTFDGDINHVYTSDLRRQWTSDSANVLQQP